jgi:hypothetical protein
MRNLLLFFLLLAVPAVAQVRYEVVVVEPSDANSKLLFHENSGAVIKNDHVMFAIETPRGWVLDRYSGVSDGLGAMYYPWSDKPKARLYIDTFNKVPQIKTAEMLKTLEVEKTGKTKQVYIEDVEKLSTGGKETAAVIHVRAEGRSIQIAYIDEPDCVVKLVVAATSDEELKKAEMVFRRWVGSYLFMPTEKVQVTLPGEK